MALQVIQTVASMAERHGGPTRSIGGLCLALARQGASVTLLTGDAPGATGLLLPDPALVTSHCVGRAGPWLPAFAAAVARHAGTGAILHDNGLWSPANIAASAAARRHRLPLVISPHGMLAPWALRRSAARKRLAWALYQRRNLAGAAGLIATAAPEAASIRARVAALPVATIANGIDTPPLPDRRDRLVAPRRQILFLSRLHPVKNLSGLVTAWAQIAGQAEFAAWTLRIAGPDEVGERAVITALAAQLRLGDRLVIDAAVPEAGKAAAFAAADLFILPSFSENFGIVVAEALAHGVPVIAAQGTPWAALPALGCGWHVAPDAASLASAMASAMRLSPEDRAAMGARGHAHVQGSFGWDAIARHMLGFYDWLRHGGAVPDFVDCPRRR
jgi:glycosyltransferase involved in cell wall biosynthesis